ncbi:hypothetical protein [Pseudolysinimonas sp.]
MAVNPNSAYSRMPGLRLDAGDIESGLERLAVMSKAELAAEIAAQRVRARKSDLMALVESWTEYRKDEFDTSVGLLDHLLPELETRFSDALGNLGYGEASRTAVYRAAVEFAGFGSRDVGPLDKRPEREWREWFKRFGFVHAEIVQDTVKEKIVRMPHEMDAPTELKLPVYRGSSERLSRRWSWTNKIHIAAWFAQGFHEEGAVWVCEEVSEYLARFNFNDRHEDGEWHYWTEYILVPTKVRRMEHSEVAEMLTGGELAAWREFMATAS